MSVLSVFAEAMKQHLDMVRVSSNSSGMASSADEAEAIAAAVAAGLAAAASEGEGGAGVLQRSWLLADVHAAAVPCLTMLLSFACPTFVSLLDDNGLPWLKVVAFDGNVKCTRYKSAGCSAGYAKVPRTWTIFLGEAHDIVWDFADAGALPLSLPADGAAAAATTAAAAAGVEAADDEDLELLAE
jgi:hypothetical protein